MAIKAKSASSPSPAPSAAKAVAAKAAPKARSAAPKKIAAPAAQPEAVVPLNVKAAPKPIEAPVPAAPAVASPSPITPAAIVAPVSQKLENTMTASFKTAEEFVAFSQGNLEAIMKSGQIWATGLQDLSKSMAATAQASLDETVAAFKALSGVKSVKEAVDLQATLARTSLEKAVSGSSQMADASFKLAEQAMAPLTERFKIAASKMNVAV